MSNSSSSSSSNSTSNRRTLVISHRHCNASVHQRQPLPIRIKDAVIYLLAIRHRRIHRHFIRACHKRISSMATRKVNQKNIYSFVVLPTASRLDILFSRSKFQQVSSILLSNDLPVEFYHSKVQKIIVFRYTFVVLQVFGYVVASGFHFAFVLQKHTQPQRKVKHPGQVFRRRVRSLTLHSPERNRKSISCPHEARRVQSGNQSK